MLCDCYRVRNEIKGWIDQDTPIEEQVTRCFGTREADICTCGGDESKCNFYPSVRARAIKEKQENPETVKTLLDKVRQSVKSLDLSSWLSEESKRQNIYELLDKIENMIGETK